jgi:hypothetical protein
MFYNEFDILELRLRELYNHVDVFVIVESDRTNTNCPKPYYFEQAQERYRPWLDNNEKFLSQLDVEQSIKEKSVGIATGRISMKL